MPFIFVDSFDHYTDITQKGWTQDGNSGVTIGIQAAGGRNGTSSLRLTKGDQSCYQGLANLATIYCGFSFKKTADVPEATWVVRLQDGTSNQCGISLDTSGHLVAQGNGTLGTSSYIFPNNADHYIEVQFVIHNSAGVVVVKVDGTIILNLTSQDTQNTANAYATRFKLGDGGTSGYTLNRDHDDLYIHDTAFQGDVRIEAILPTGAGNYSEWTPSAGSNWQNVDENPPNSDTDYNSSATVAQRDLYAYPNITTGAGTVKAVAVNTFARKDDGGTREIAAMARHSTTDGVGATKALSSSYAFLQDFFVNNPSTSAAWTIGEVNAAEFGQKVIT